MSQHQKWQPGSERDGLVKKARTTIAVTCLVAGASLAMGTSAQQSASAGLAHDTQTQGPVAIPPSERALQAVVAISWFKVSDEERVLEGAIFDRSGNLPFCDVTGRRRL